MSENPWLATSAFAAIYFLTSSAGAVSPVPIATGVTCGQSSVPLPFPSGGDMSSNLCSKAEAEAETVVTTIQNDYVGRIVDFVYCPSCPTLSVGCQRSVDSSFTVPTSTTYKGPSTVDCPDGTYSCNITLGWRRCLGQLRFVHICQSELAVLPSVQLQVKSVASRALGPCNDVW